MAKTDKCSTTITFSCTPEQRDSIFEIAALYRISTSKYLRNLTSGTRFPDLANEGTVTELYAIRDGLRRPLEVLEQGDAEAPPNHQGYAELVAAVEAAMGSIDVLALKLGERRYRHALCVRPEFRMPGVSVSVWGVRASAKEAHRRARKEKGTGT